MTKTPVLSILLLLLMCMPVNFSGQQLITSTLIHDNMEREYILYVPGNYDDESPTPLVINYHGYTSSALIQVAYGDFRPVADTAGFLVVHPQGTEDAFGNTHWNVGFGASDVDDVGFTAALIDSLSLTWHIDPDRVYAAGMSNGGFMCYRLACELGERIAAIASVTGSMTEAQSDNCTPGDPKPVMEIHGTADFVVPYNGGGLNRSIPEVLGFWAGSNNCTTEPIITDVPDINPNDGSTVEHHLYADGDKGVTVEHFKVLGGGHTWPGTELGGSTTNYDINASAEIWKFFSRFDIDGLIVPSHTSTRAAHPTSIKVYPNPAGDFAFIESTDHLSGNFVLYNFAGEMLLDGEIRSKIHRLDIGHLPNGIYFLRTGNSTNLLIKGAFR